MMEARLLEVEMIKHNRDKYKISTPTPRAALMAVMVDAEEVAADMVAMVDREEEVEVAIDGTDSQSRV